MALTNPYEPPKTVDQPLIDQSLKGKWLQLSMMDFAIGVVIISLLSISRSKGWLPVEFTNYLLDEILLLSPIGLIALYVALVASGKRQLGGAIVSCACICLVLLAVFVYTFLYSVYGA